MQTLNIFKLVSIGSQILLSIANLQTGKPSVPFKIDNTFYVITKVNDYLRSNPHLMNPYLTMKGK